MSHPAVARSLLTSASVRLSKFLTMHVFTPELDRAEPRVDGELGSGVLVGP